MELLEKFGLLVSYANEEKELTNLDDDEIKTLNDVLKLLESYSN